VKLERGSPVFLHVLNSKALLKKNQKTFQNSLSHRILRHMHEALNIDENKN